MKSLVITSVVLMLAACGEQPQASPDATGPDPADAALHSDAPVAIDAAIDGWPTDRDTWGPLPDYVTAIWERAVQSGGTQLYDSRMLPTGVALIAWPDLVLMDTDGNEAGRTPFPATDVAANTGFARASGDLAVVTIGSGLVVAVQEYAGGNLAESTRTTLGDIDGVALGEVNGVLYTVTNSNTDGVHLLTIESGAVVDTKTIANGPPGLPRTALASADGKLVLCTWRWTTNTYEVIRLDPTTAEFTSVTLPSPDTDSNSCRLTRGDNGIHAMWNTYEGLRWALLSADGSSLVGGPYTVTDFGLTDTVPWTTGVAYANGKFVAVVPFGQRLKLYAMDENTGAISAAKDVYMDPGGLFTDRRATIASDGTNLYVGFAPEAVPQLFRVQKLPPIQWQSP